MKINNVFKILLLLVGVGNPLTVFTQNRTNFDHTSLPSFDVYIFPNGVPPDTLTNGWVINPEDMVLLKVYGERSPMCQLMAEPIGFSEATFLPSPYRRVSKDTTYIWFRISDLCAISNPDIPPKQVSTFFVRFPEWKGSDPVFGRVMMLKTREKVSVSF